MSDIVELDVIDCGSVIGTVQARTNKRGKTYVEVKFHKEYEGTNGEKYKVYNFNRTDLQDLEEMLPNIRASLETQIDNLRDKRNQERMQDRRNRDEPNG